MYQHILIATDGSDLSDKAIEHGLGLAKALAAKVTIVTVTAPFSPYAVGIGMEAGGAELYREQAARLATEYLDRASKAATAAGIDCKVVHVEHPEPHRAIIRAAEQNGCDAILMASHGRRGLSAIVLGSETVKVLTHCGVPVIVYREQTPHAFFAAS
jgi:nucleotide-binding universal stress UspA family protein